MGQHVRRGGMRSQRVAEQSCAGALRPPWIFITLGENGAAVDQRSLIRETVAGLRVEHGCLHGFPNFRSRPKADIVDV